MERIVRSEEDVSALHTYLQRQHNETQEVLFEKGVEEEEEEWKYRESVNLYSAHMYGMITMK
jgi:hypothetical protein